MKIKILFILVLIGLYSCTAISEKATEKATKENAYLSTFLKAPSANLVKTFGKPTQTLAENDQTIYVSEVKAKVLNYQRQSPIDNKNTVSGSVSTCWDRH